MNQQSYIKPLKWKIGKDGGIYATPYGLRFEYHITKIENNLFELALIDKNGDWDKKSFSYQTTIKEAQEISKKHYLRIINSHLKLNTSL